MPAARPRQPVASSLLKTPDDNAVIALNLPGIDVAAVLDRLDDDQRLLVALLLEFDRDYADAAKNIRVALSASRKDIVLEAAGMVHAIKGVSGNLGAQVLHEAASVLELAIKQDDRNDWPKHLQYFEQSLSVVIASIALLKSQEKMVTGAASSTISGGDIPLNLPVITQKMGELVKLLTTNDIKSEQCLISLNTLLKGADIGKQLALLAEQIDIYDFNAALQTLVAIAKVMNIPGYEKYD